MPRATTRSLSSGSASEEVTSNVWRFAAVLPPLLSWIAVSRTYSPGGAEKLRSKEMNSGVVRRCFLPPSGAQCPH